MTGLRSARSIWGMPTVLAAVSGIGLVSALFGDGLWDIVSWLCLSAPLAVILPCLARSSLHRER